jgi:hypothetical protein
MQKRFVWLLGLFCAALILPAYAQETDAGRRETKSDARTERRVDRQTERKTERRTERHPEAQGKAIDYRGEKKKERQDKYLGDEAKQAREEKRPQRKAAADLDANGTLSEEEKATYKEKMKTTHEDIKDSRRELAVEHTKEYKDLHAKYDTDADGILSQEEWKLGKDEFKATFGDNVAEDIELYKVNKEKRDSLLVPPAPTEEPASEIPAEEVPAE